MLLDKKVALVSLGCDKNLMDSEVMLGLLQEAGAIVTVDEELADAVIINTCGFVLDAADESVETIARVIEYKRGGLGTVIIVAGCMAQRYKEDLLEEMPEIDAVVGTSDYGNIVSILAGIYEGKKGLFVGDKNNNISEELLQKRLLSTPNHYAYIKISEGCDNNCTYCTIPQIRGKYRSRKMESLIDEASSLAKLGVKELIIVAQDTSVYGKDLYGEEKLHELLRKLSEIDGVIWIRLLYCYPEHICDELINEMTTNKKICHYIDMPIQHSNDKVLKQMGRQSTNSQLKNIINKLRVAMPDIVIRTTLITGFPGETKHEFQELLSFVREMRFERLGVFAYSREEGTAADLMDGHLTEKTKERRREVIMLEQQKISSEISNSNIGKTFSIIVEGAVPYEKNVFFGRSYMDCPDIDGVVYIRSSKPLEAGNFISVLIAESSEYDLIGDEVNGMEFTK